MVNMQKNIFKIISLSLVALTFASESNADNEIYKGVVVGGNSPKNYPATRPYPGPVKPGDEFYDYLNNRELKVSAAGTVMPAQEPGPLTQAFTYNRDYKPNYNPEDDRVQYKVQNDNYEGGVINTNSPTVTPSWLDKLTTYNQEQRRPWNPYSQKVKKAPANLYYNGIQAKKDNKHYLQDNLQPVPYMYGSASLVLRKEQQSKNYELPKEMTLDRIINPDSAMRNEEDIQYVASYTDHATPMGGYASLNDRYNCNQRAANSQGVIVTDPNSIMNEYYEKYAGPEGYTFHSNVMIGTPKRTNAEVITKITKPETAWNAKLKGSQDLSRPGDFDYNRKRTSVSAYRVEDNMASGYGSEIKYGSGFSSVRNVVTDARVEGYAYNTGSQRGAMVQNDNSKQTFFIENGDAPYRGEKGDAPKAENYEVESGDTLSQISEKEKIYGNWTLWPLIYDANRNQIEDPDLIRPGQNLDIPRDYSNREANNATYRAREKQVPVSLNDGR